MSERQRMRLGWRIVAHRPSVTNTCDKVSNPSNSTQKKYRLPAAHRPALPLSN